MTTETSDEHARPPVLAYSLQQPTYILRTVRPDRNTMNGQGSLYGECMSCVVFPEASERREIVSGEVVAIADLREQPVNESETRLDPHQSRNAAPLTRLTPTGASDRTRMSMPRILLLLSTYARRLENTSGKVSGNWLHVMSSESITYPPTERTAAL